MSQKQPSEDFFDDDYVQREDDYIGPEEINNGNDRDIKTSPSQNVIVEMQQVKSKNKFVDDGTYSLAAPDGDDPQHVVESGSKLKNVLYFLAGFILAAAIFLGLGLGGAFNQTYPYSGQNGEIPKMTK